MQSHVVTAEEIVSDIEFELAQGVVARGDLGQAAGAIRQYGNRLRGELLRPGRDRLDARELAQRQFHLNDMILALLGEIVTAVEGVRADWRRVRERVIPPSPPAAASTPGSAPAAASTPAPTASPVDVAQVADAMRAERLALALDVRTGPRVPVLGSLALRVRLALHELALFYVNRLAERQAAVNAVYGEALLRLAEQCRAQEAEIAALRSQLAALSAQHEAVEAVEDKDTQQG